MKLKDRLRPLPGDWVIRKEEPEDKKLDALAKVLQAELKWNVHFEKREAEHDVIVATGAYVKPKPDADGPGAIDVFVDGKDSHGMAAGDLNGFCRSLGELCNVEFVVEATGGKSGIFWRNHTGANLSREDADKMLANVAAQTGLTFARARRVTSHWVAVTEEKGR
jgi:hypothetical protein